MAVGAVRGVAVVAASAELADRFAFTALRAQPVCDEGWFGGCCPSFPHVGGGAQLAFGASLFGPCGCGVTDDLELGVRALRAALLAMFHGALHILVSAVVVELRNNTIVLSCWCPSVGASGGL